MWQEIVAKKRANKVLSRWNQQTLTHAFITWHGNASEQIWEKQEEERLLEAEECSLIVASRDPKAEMTVERAQILLKWRGYADEPINAGIALLTPHLDKAVPSDKINVQCFLEIFNLRKRPKMAQPPRVRLQEHNMRSPSAFQSTDFSSKCPRKRLCLHANDE
jgi:hypothetical protein